MDDSLHLHSAQQRSGPDGSLHGTAFPEKEPRHRRQFPLPPFYWLRCLLDALAVWLEDGRPHLFSQVRVGSMDAISKCIKSLHVPRCGNAEGTCSRRISTRRRPFKLKDDPRIHEVGKWLAKVFFMNEHAQPSCFIGQHVARGTSPPKFLVKSLNIHRALGGRLANSKRHHLVWQISGRSESIFAGQVQLDVNYIESQTFLMDLRIWPKPFPLFSPERVLADERLTDLVILTQTRMPAFVGERSRSSCVPLLGQSLIEIGFRIWPALAPKKSLFWPTTGLNNCLRWFIRESLGP